MCDDKINEFPIEAAFVVCYTGNRDRHDRVIVELDRVGIKNPHVIWTFPSPYRKFVLDRIPHIKELDEHPGSWGATIGNYRAVKTGYELGCKSILICEDDCRFLKDVALMNDILRTIPPDYDFLMLDSFYRYGLTSTMYERWNECKRACSTGCYIINRRAMEKLIDMYESPVSGKYKTPMMRNSDHWTNKEIIGKNFKIYFSDPNVAIQCLCPGSSNYGDIVFKGYRNLGIQLDKYMPF